ncbi:MAG: hypothetical protein VX768_06295 [Planctomycetota bacterium]|nr:hypothetical protein [Planctomycetota bacterium]
MKNFFYKTGWRFGLVLVAWLSLLSAGCGPGKNQVEKVGAAGSGWLNNEFLLKAEPGNVIDVVAARKSEADVDELTVRGRIGGSLEPWVENRAAFSLVDASIKACSDGTPEGEACSCDTPWDYCCKTDELKGAVLLVKFVDQDGKVVKQDARELFGIRELQQVVVRGAAQRDSSGNLTILARKMFVHR